MDVPLAEHICAAKDFYLSLGEHKLLNNPAPPAIRPFEESQGYQPDALTLDLAVNAVEHSRITVEDVHYQGTICIFLAQPSEDFFGTTKYLGHECHLRGLLRKIVLVDAYCIGPEILRARSVGLQTV
jgi:hypothetical protein